MDDVVVVGGGPAGAFAAMLLARDGFTVRIFDRACFPRGKLCGDTINPGASRVLARHLDIRPLIQRSRPIDGMLLTGPGDVAVRGRYGNGILGHAIERRELDHWLLRQAAEAGALVCEDCAVDSAWVADGGVRGVRVRNGSESSHPARLVIAADGRHSTLAFGLGLAKHPRRPRRWAIGAYFENVGELSDAGEMHVRRGHYIGVAPMPGGIANACVVMPHSHGTNSWRDLTSLLIGTLAGDPRLAPRFATARMIDAPVGLGPMAVDVPMPGAPGILLAGDAAGFIDPMTGDGLNFALRGAELTAQIARQVLNGELGAAAAPIRLRVARDEAFVAKWRFNRGLRQLVASPRGVSGAAMAARLLPGIFEAMIRYAGDA